MGEIAKSTDQRALRADVVEDLIDAFTEACAEDGATMLEAYQAAGSLSRCCAVVLSERMPAALEALSGALSEVTPPLPGEIAPRGKDASRGISGGWLAPA